MKNSNSNDWLIPLLAAFAIYVPLSATAPSPNQQSSAQSQPPALIQVVPTPTPAPTPGPGRVPGEAARLLCDFFGLEPDLEHRAGLTPQQKSEVENRGGDYCRIKSVLNPKGNRRPPPSSYEEIERLIATVPDPKDTRLDHQFDRALDAIRRAVEAAGYYFDRFWLPWDRSKAAALADPKTAQMATRNLREPGVILFRHSEQKKLLLLFLVGETQTGGIHRAAFQSALRQIEELPRRVGAMTEGTAEERPLRILGPYFSSSADSLAILLNERLSGQSPPPQVRIITGSTGTFPKKEFLEKTKLTGDSFYSAEVDSAQASKKFYEDLMERDRLLKPSDGGGPARAYIALLSESGTGLGQVIRKNIKRWNEAAEDEKQPLLLSVTYPVHISQLRVEAAKNPLRDAMTGAPAERDANLPLPMSEPGSPGSKETAPLFSPLETVTMELSLNEILTAIHRERIRYVRVSTSDPQDRIFLVREIRKHCPNTTIFIHSSDLLYLHSESNLDFQGALIIATYPLFGLNQLWTYPFEGDRRRPQFPTPTEQGIFNATLALLDRADRMLEYGFPFKEYNVGDKRHPALWLGIVGRNGIWPVKVFDDVDPSGYTWPAPVMPPPSNGGKRAAPRLGLSENYRSPTGAGFLLLLGSVCLLLSLILLAQLSDFRGRGRAGRADPDQLRPHTRLAHFAWIRRGLFGQVFGDEEFYCYRQDRRLYLLGCCVSLLTASLFISAVTMLPAWILWNRSDGDALQSDWGRHRVIGVVAFMILVFTLGAFIWLMASVVRWIVSGRRRVHGRVWILPALVVGASMITFVGWGLFEVIFYFERPEKVFFFLRATELTSGVSVLLPALLVGLAMFLSFFTMLRRLNLAERMPCLRAPQQRPDEAPQFLRFDHERATSFEGVKPLEDRVKEMIVRPVFRTPGAALLMVLILAVYWHFFLKHFIPSVDGRRFDWFFGLAFYVVPLTLILALLRLFWLWVATKRLLRRLSWSPLISQYAAGHAEEKRFAALPRIDLMTPTPTYTALTLSVRQARSFYNALKFGPEQAEERNLIGQLVERAESELSLSLGADAKGDWQKALRKRRYSQAALAELTERVSGLLEDSWLAPGDAGADAAWRDEGKFFLITHVVAFLQHVFAQMQNLVGLVTMGLLLMLLAAISYPFQPREPLLLFSWVAILTSVVVTLFIFVSANRDKTLSLLTGTTPGKVTVTRDLVFRVLIHGVVPVIALLGVQFPEALRQIFSWLNVFAGKGS